MFDYVNLMANNPAARTSGSDSIDYTNPSQKSIDPSRVSNRRVQRG